VTNATPLNDLGTCLVTGAAGFLGSHLVQGLLDEGYSVRAVIRNTPLTLEHPKLEIVKGDIEDAPRMLELCQGIDTVFITSFVPSMKTITSGSAAITSLWKFR
jgi:UDP-glucose 4-epimerase